MLLRHLAPLAACAAASFLTFVSASAAFGQTVFGKDFEIFGQVGIGCAGVTSCGYSLGVNNLGSVIKVQNVNCQITVTPTTATMRSVSFGPVQNAGFVKSVALPVNSVAVDPNAQGSAIYSINVPVSLFIGVGRSLTVATNVSAPATTTFACSATGVLVP